MPASALTFRIFLSSPGDVPQERDDAQVVVDEINDSGEFEDMFTKIELYRWDNPKVVLPMPVTDIPQKSVDIYMLRPSACDLVVVIFWSRMGSPLVMDDREYLSGTHYEYSEALGEYEQHGTPIVWLYRCQEKLHVDFDDVNFDKKKAQYDRVKAFFTQFMDEEGRFTGGVNGYPTHTDFKTLFKGQLQTYLRHLRQKGTTQPPPPPTKPKIDVPYKGLRPLRKADVPIFFGRTAESLDVLARVKNKWFVPILGASGSGKSSLVMAGVLPQLEERGWVVIQCTPDIDPFYQIALAIVSLPDYRNQSSDKVLEARPLATHLRAEQQRLVIFLRDLYPNRRVALYIDQFEELFTLTEKAASTQVKSFIEAIRHPADGLTTIITMRADFYETALGYVDELQQDTYGLKKPSAFALYEMITRPANDAGYVLDDQLAETIITTLGDDTGALALMAYVMEALYRRAKERNDKHITTADYEALGGVEKAMNTLAEKAYADLPFEHKEAVLRNVFFHLIALTPDENGQLVPTRGRYPLDNFKPNSPEQVLIDRFADARLLVKDGKMVEVAHEAILRHWEQLVAWIDQNKGSMALYRQFERDANVWSENPESTPLTQHESQKYFYQALETLGLIWDSLPDPLKSYTEPESARLLREIEIPNTPPARRLIIGHRLSAIGDPRPGVGVIHTYKIPLPDMAWCLILAGEFIMGSDNHESDEKPAHTFYLDDFYMSRYLVTYQQYATFENAPDFDDETWWAGFPDDKKRTQDIQRFQYAYHPRENVTWYSAMAFCRWLTHHTQEANVPMRVWDMATKTYQTMPYSHMKITLPSEAEYEKMARGGDGRIYPYGDDFDATKGNTTDTGIGMTSGVGMFPQGESPYGVLDASGNVWTWTRSIKKGYEYNSNDGREDETSKNVRSLRGGSWDDNQGNARASFRNYGYPNYRSNFIGFFVVYRPY